MLATDHGPEDDDGTGPERNMSRTHSREDCINRISKDIDESMIAQRIEIEKNHDEGPLHRTEAEEPD